MQLENSAKSHSRSFTDLMRVRFKGVLDPIGNALNRLGIAPNTMTLLGLAGNLLGAILLAQGRMSLGGLIVLLMGPVDGIDGTMARLRGEPSRFGAFVDSVTDRWSESVIFAGLLWHYLAVGNDAGVLLVFAATVGSVMVSYTKSRAETLGYECGVGVLTRLERYLVLAPALLFGIDIIGLWVVAILANITALQRAYHVRKQARSGTP